MAAIAADNRDDSPPANVRALLTAKYPGETLSAWCGGGFLGQAAGGASALFDAHKRSFRVVWVTNGGTVRELQIVPAFEPESKFELQCLDAAAAKTLKQTLRESEAIRDFLRLPTGQGALCYFASETETKCWSRDRGGKLIDIGGWQT